jgi:hypothetical protein
MSKHVPSHSVKKDNTIDNGFRGIDPTKQDSIGIILDIGFVLV